MYSLGFLKNSGNLCFRAKIINDIWLDNNYIKNETIINSFLYCSISQKQNGSIYVLLENVL